MIYNNVKALPLFGKYAVLDRGSKEKKPRVAKDKAEYDEDDLSNLMLKQAKNKRKRREEETISEKVQTKRLFVPMKRIALKNNAGLRHISVFINLIEYAKANGLSVTIIEMRKRLKPEDAIKEWGTIRGWCGKNAPETCAITIGRKTNGWWSLRVLVVGGKEDEDCYKPALPLHSYLMLKRGWVTSDHAGSKEAKNLEEHYLTRLSSDDETFDQYVSEMYEVYRAALRMPKSTRTYRTEEAEKVLEERKLHVTNNASYPVNGRGYDSSPSGLALCEVEKRGGKVVSSWWLGKTMDDDENEGPTDNDEDLLSAEF
ncbi:MAG: hypothetical protein VB076_07205 [Synergistaceae bacterium]|nr:hypothetical protein [Synergistaceae bacterium]